MQHTAVPHNPLNFGVIIGGLVRVAGVLAGADASGAAELLTLTELAGANAPVDSELLALARSILTEDPLGVASLPSGKSETQDILIKFF